LTFLNDDNEYTLDKSICEENEEDSELEDFIPEPLSEKILLKCNTNEIKESPLQKSNTNEIKESPLQKSSTNQLNTIAIKSNPIAIKPNKKTINDDNFKSISLDENDIINKTSIDNNYFSAPVNNSNDKIIKINYERRNSMINNNSPLMSPINFVQW
jgi:hypothetical protein